MNKKTKRIQASLSPVEYDILKKNNKNQTELLKEDILGIVLGNPALSVRIEYLKKSIKDYDKMIQFLSDERNLLRKELEEYYNKLNYYDVTITPEFEGAVNHFEAILRKNHYERLESPNGFGLKKVGLDMAKMCADEAHADLNVFLKFVDDELMRLELEGYNDLLRRWSSSEK